MLITGKIFITNVSELQLKYKAGHFWSAFYLYII